MTTKYPILDPDVKLKLLGACRDDKERGLILILLETGMHVSCIASPRDRKGKPRERPKVIREGRLRFVEWKRPKTNRLLRSNPITSVEAELIEAFLKMPSQSGKHYDTICCQIGKRAGYDGVSSMTLRHTRCIRALRPKEQGGEGYTIWEVPHVMGCTLDVATRNYAALSGEQLFREREART